MRYSIRVKLTMLMFFIVGSVLVATWTFNQVFSETYYLYLEKQTILKTFSRVKTILYEANEKDAQYLLQLEELSFGSDIRFMITKADDITGTQKVLYSNINESTRSFSEIFGYINTVRQRMTNEDADDDDSKTDYLSPFASIDGAMDTLVNDGYVILQTKGRSTGKQSLYLFGFTDNGYTIGLSSSIANLKASAKISSRFLAYTGLGGIMFGSFLIFLFSLHFTRPIHVMADVAERMSKLDFDAKVNVHSGDELEELGKSMNEMSEKLEMAIGDLKSANLELMKDIKKKEEVDEMRKEFISHVSHELKTPIALIQGYAEGLKDNIADDEESRDFYCEVIMDEAMKMNKMVKNLLELNQLEFGQNQLNLQRFDICEVIRNKINASQILFDKKHNRVEFDQKDPVYVWADEYMIEEVVSNYLSNALNHVYEEGLIRVWIEEKEKEISVHVYNDGDRIPDSELEKLWIKFYKVDKARTREYGGNGIGLSIVAASMKAHGKDFGVKNCENGVEFYFNLDTAV